MALGRPFTSAAVAQCRDDVDEGSHDALLAAVGEAGDMLQHLDGGAFDREGPQPRVMAEFEGRDDAAAEPRRYRFALAFAAADLQHLAERNCCAGEGGL